MGDSPRPALSDATPEGMVCAMCASSYPAGTRYCPVDGSLLRPAVSGQDPCLGTVIDDRYYLLEKIGQGGMGDVYLGEHVRTQRRCAVKVIGRVHAGDPEALNRFIREATNAGRISHPHVATVYDFGETAEGIAYLAMEFVDGEPLSKLLAREGALPPRRVISIARQVAEGVGAAHDLGIVHRDLKPGNILVARDRKGGDLVKVVDFGIARAPAEDGQALTQTGMVVGTPEYMSPEQLVGDPVDARTDIYSLGCILYQMLTGEQAFEGPTAQRLTRRLTGPPPHPREQIAGVPDELDTVVVMAMGRLPHERYQSMEALRDALLAVPAEPAPPVQKRLAGWLGQYLPFLRSAAPETDPASGTPSVHDHAGAGDGAARTDPGAAGPAIASAPGASGGIEAAVHGAADPTAAPRQTGEEPLVGAGATPAEPAPEPQEPHTGGKVHVAAAEPGAAGPEAPFADASEDAAAAPVPGTGEQPRTEVIDPAEAEWPALAPKRPLPKRVAGGIAAVLVLAAIGFAVFSGEDEPAVPEQAETDTEVVAPPPPVPDPAELEAVHAALGMAETDAANEQFAAAFRRLAEAEIGVTALLERFPGYSDLQALADSVRAQIEQTGTRCEAFRRLALARRETPPACSQED
jgi:hypothetical protein